MSSGTGTKVTSDPKSLNETKVENPGIVTSDSLAAESVNSGGQFAAGSHAREPLSQPSHSTTSNTTDASNATQLDPARDAPSRPDAERFDQHAVFEAGRTHAHSGEAAADASIDQGANHQVPKGKNLQEANIDPNAPNASFNGEIGTKNDPGRVALQEMEAHNAPGSSGAGPRQVAISNDGQFDALKQTKA